MSPDLAGSEGAGFIEESSRAPPVYLDYNGTTPIDEEVVAAMNPYFSKFWGNPSSSHYYGLEAKRGMQYAREKVASLIGRDDSIFPCWPSRREMVSWAFSLRRFSEGHFFWNKEKLWGKISVLKIHTARCSRPERDRIHGQRDRDHQPHLFRLFSESWEERTRHHATDGACGGAGDVQGS